MTPPYITAQIERLAGEAESMRIERDSARAVARVLAHSYTTESTPPRRIIDEAMAYPVRAGLHEWDAEGLCRHCPVDEHSDPMPPCRADLQRCNGRYVAGTCADCGLAVHRSQLPAHRDETETHWRTP